MSSGECLDFVSLIYFTQNNLDGLKPWTRLYDMYKSKSSILNTLTCIVRYCDSDHVVDFYNFFMASVFEKLDSDLIGKMFTPILKSNNPEILKFY